MWPQGRTEAARGDKARARAGPEFSKTPVPGSRQSRSYFLGVEPSLNVWPGQNTTGTCICGDGELIRPLSLAWLP